MTAQRFLFDDKPNVLTTQQQFAGFLDAHPWFLDEVIRMARERKAHGDKRWSTKAAFEILRPRCRRDQPIPGVGRVGLNNNFSSLCARLVMEEAPDLKGFFETR